ncbi:MAG: dTMP kinase [Candidatus Omnitrophica bacterium]|nr:dTMP kinase [Candidatus Omnitrophota bacterium]
MARGLFITFEGSEGSGKSTQSRLLASYLKRRKHKVLYLREPGGSLISEKIRKILLDRKHEGMSAECEMLLYMASRAQVVTSLIQPALSAGVIVICDRFLDSTRAYQGYGLGVSMALIDRVGRFATRSLVPDLTVVMDLPVKRGLRHRLGKRDRIEQRSLAYHRRVRRGYVSISRQDPQRVKLVKVEKDRRLTQEKIRELVAGIMRDGI